MATIRELTAALSEAMGVRPRALEWTTDELYKAEIIGAADELASCTDATNILIAFAGSIDLSDPVEVLSRFEKLPLIDAVEHNFTDRETLEKRPMPACTPLMQWSVQFSGFGEYLATVVEDYCGMNWMISRLHHVVLGHGQGQTFAILEFSTNPANWAKGETRSYALKFGTGETRPPDDAAPCRLRRRTIIPGEIVAVLRRVIGEIVTPLRFGTAEESARYLAANFSGTRA